MNKQGNNDEKDFNPETHFILSNKARLGFQSFKTFKPFKAFKAGQSKVDPRLCSAGHNYGLRS